MAVIFPERDPSWSYRRARWRGPRGHFRSLYAWRDAGGWQCQVSGHAMRPRTWWSPTQSSALTQCRVLPALMSWGLLTPKGHLYALWDGVADEYRPRLFALSGETGFLFAEASA